MKKLFKPLIKAAGNYYEGTTWTKVPRSKSRKVRKYEHVDVSKDFERRQKGYSAERQKMLKDIYQVHGKELLDDYGKIRNELILNSETTDLVELGESSDLHSKFLVSGVRKMCVLGIIKYHQLNHNLFEDSKLHPESQKKLEELHYLVEHNLPVEKELLFNMVPELFRYEINKLPIEDQALFELQKKAFTRADGEILQVDVDGNSKEFSGETEFDKILTMEHYLLDQSMDIFNLYKNDIEKYLTDKNYANFGSYFKQLEVMDSENRLPWENAFMQDVQELRTIKEDIRALTAKFMDPTNKPIVLPNWIHTDRMKDKYISDVKYINKYCTIDIRDTVLIPPPPNTGPSFEERLRIATGDKLDEFLDRDNQQFIKDANARKPITLKDINEKDESLIQRMNIVAQAVEVEDPPLSAPDQDQLYNTMREGIQGISSQDHRILIDEVYKVLYLNNEDPETYNVQFWAKHFKIEPAAIRNIFNYLAYPITDPMNKDIKRILFFIDIDMVKHREKLTDLTREDYIAYLEEDYYRRLEAEQKEKEEFLGAKTLRQELIEDPIVQRGIDNFSKEYKEPEEIKAAFKVGQIIGDDSIMEDLETEVKKFKAMLEDEKSKKKNQKKL